MTTRLYKTTNAKLIDCLVMLDELISWADADAQHAAENNAPDTARDDRKRGERLRRARLLVQRCER